MSKTVLDFIREYENNPELEVHGPYCLLNETFESYCVRKGRKTDYIIFETGWSRIVYFSKSKYGPFIKDWDDLPFYMQRKL